MSLKGSHVPDSIQNVIMFLGSVLLLTIPKSFGLFGGNGTRNPRMPAFIAQREREWRY